MKSKATVAAALPPALRVARLDGPYVFDHRGKRYIDFVTGWCVGNLGWNHPKIKRAVEKHRGPDYVYPGFDYAPWNELAALLASIAPGRLSVSFRATGGSEAVDLALQAAMIHTGRRGIVALEGAYHGNTVGGLSVGDEGVRESAKNLLAHCARVPLPLDERAIPRVERALRKRDVAAFIMEPISVNLGVHIPARRFMRELQRLCRKYGTLLVMDEVATGFGRTGRLFASEHYGIEPDLMTIAKALSNGAAPIGALLATPTVAKSLENHGIFYSTYGWHPRSVAAAIATVRVWKEEGGEILRNVVSLSAAFGDSLATMPFERVVDIRVAGLAIGVDFGSAAYAEKVGERCRKVGLLISVEDEIALLLPPLNIDPAVAAQGLGIFQRSL